jgi:hypothetical protein
MINAILMIMIRSKACQLSVKAIVLGKGYLEDIQSVGINVFECVLLLVLNEPFESADRLGPGYFDWKDASRIIAENKAAQGICHVEVNCVKNESGSVGVIVGVIVLVTFEHKFPRVRRPCRVRLREMSRYWRMHGDCKKK